ncbi:hypothetical protein Ahy_A02g009446 isoform C [Arachis hypogaea]|uniref:(+)-neomenthol dehydrogenase n=1 Tax=Arachis hypogaea TaxID=3818 RepID=A0A445EH08_ARAHY|nr:hypothetical protein Ahy_A02g009446 isoform C [Arachis hypogaea]
MEQAPQRYAVVTGANKGIGIEIINNAGIGGLVIKDNDLVPQVLFQSRELSDDVIEKAGIVQTFELAEECLQINYYGAKRTSEALLPFLQLSESPRIVNVSSSLGKLKCVSNEWAKGILGDAENLTEERVDEVLNEFLKDIKEGCLERKGWPKVLGAYIISKAAMNAYTRIVAKKYPTICINSVCPGYVKTDITANTGILTAEEGAASPVKIALLSNASSGLFYSQNEIAKAKPCSLSVNCSKFIKLRWKILHKVVTGANKGIGLEIVRQLASNGVKVVLTSRDEKRGLHALKTLKDLSGFVLFHQLDVADPASVASLADFIKSKFGKLDILVNNAGVSGVVIKDTDLLPSLILKGEELSDDEIEKARSQTYELAQDCLQINYYGAKRTSESLLSLLQLSDSPRIVNVSSFLGQLKCVLNEWAKGVFKDADNLTEEKIDMVLNEFLEDFKEGRLESKGWPKAISAYVLSKAALNAYTRILAKKFPTFCINSVCPGYVKTDMTSNTGFITVEEGAASPVRNSYEDCLEWGLEDEKFFT